VRILVLSNLLPHPAHSVRAANVVIFELVRALAKQPDAVCGFVNVRMDADPLPTEQEDLGLAALAECGVNVLAPVLLPSPTDTRRTLKRLLDSRIEDFYPQIRHADKVWSAVSSFVPDVILVPWSEWLTAVCADLPVAKFAYYGNPDAKSAKARLKFARSHGEVSPLETLVRWGDIRSLSRLHLRQMRKYEMLGDVAANDAEYYTRHGHPNAFYVRNLWIDRSLGAWRKARQEREKSGVIIGNIGKLGGTGNTLGLELLGRDLLPLLRKRLEGRKYHVRILGAGTLHPAVMRFMRTPEVDVAGFVPDIDEAMIEAGVLLCLNNASHFKVGQTRYLHAWSLGMCVVAHRDCALSMPEIRHNENALLGESMEEIADLLAIALSDMELRRRLGEAGYQTFLAKFTADSVAGSIVGRIRSHLSGQKDA